MMLWKEIIGKVVLQLWSLLDLLCPTTEERRRWSASAYKLCINFSSFTLPHIYTYIIFFFFLRLSLAVFQAVFELLFCCLKLRLFPIPEK